MVVSLISVVMMAVVFVMVSEFSEVFVRLLVMGLCKVC